MSSNPTKILIHAEDNKLFSRQSSVLTMYMAFHVAVPCCKYLFISLSGFKFWFRARKLYQAIALEKNSCSCYHAV